MVNVVLLHYRRSPFGTKRSLISLTFVIPFAIHIHNSLNINNIKKTAQNCLLNALKKSLVRSAGSFERSEMQILY